MFAFWWPLALIVLASVGYQVGLKEVSGGMHPLVALIMSYLSASVTAFLVYLLTSPKGHKLSELKKINPAALGLGAAVVGIEIGNIYMYRAGWTVNTAFIVTNGLIVLALMVVGAVCYGEKLRPRQLLGVVLAMAGISMIVMN